MKSRRVRLGAQLIQQLIDPVLGRKDISNTWGENPKIAILKITLPEITGDHEYPVRTETVAPKGTHVCTASPQRMQIDWYEALLVSVF